MTKITVINRAGQEIAIDGRPKLNFMDVLRDAGFDELEATCGGSCSCATCHIYIDPSFQDMIPPMSVDEHELLEGLDHRTPASRLACQIKLDESLEGITITIAPEG